MNDAIRTADSRNVDPEIDRLKDAYEAFRGLDRSAQDRCLRWLNERIAADQKHDREAGL